MKESNEKQKTGRHKSKRRPNRVEVSFSDKELARAKELAEEAGAASLPELMRHIIMHRGRVIEALTPEDRKLITDLGKMGTNIWEIRKDLMKHGTDSKMLDDIKSMYKDFKDIKEYYNDIKNKK